MLQLVGARLTSMSTEASLLNTFPGDGTTCRLQPMPSSRTEKSLS
jgi:hypothetical protein